MGLARVVLIHGAATTSRVWRRVVPLLDGYDVSCPDRPCSGDLMIEVDALRPDCGGALVAGVSGGATLGLALAAAGVPMTAAVLHEPAVGSLLPGLLDQVRGAYESGGTAAFGLALYGRAWTSAETPPDPGAVGRDLAMFRALSRPRRRPGWAPWSSRSGRTHRRPGMSRSGGCPRSSGCRSGRCLARGTPSTWNGPVSSLPPSAGSRRPPGPLLRAWLSLVRAYPAGPGPGSFTKAAASPASRPSCPAGASRVIPCGRPATVIPAGTATAARSSRFANVV